MLVYRDHACRRPTRECAMELAHSIAAARAQPNERLAALLRAAELECALADLGHPASAQLARTCDALATLWWTGRLSGAAERQLALALEHAPAELVLKRPEGYAYYALDPSSYARAARACREPFERALVIGVRSIGTSLSAVFLASLLERGTRAARFTVRPSGHPWDRQVSFDTQQTALVREHAGGRFFVVDEGPGLSGSTFLSVAEALCELDIPAASIVLCTSHEPDPTRLVARDAAARWARYAKLTALRDAAPGDAVDLSAGAWRELTYDDEEAWPASWTQQERLKFRRGGELFKFAGFAPYDARPFATSEITAQGGYAPAVRRAESGFLGFTWCPGRPATAADRRLALQRLSEYVAFRARELPAPHADTAALDTMMRVNVAEALGLELPPGIQLPVEQPVFADAHMMPHEWVLSAAGTLTKVDASDHGDDHLLPGPVDVAWDLAGAVIEWGLDQHESAELLAGFRRASGRDASRRLRPYSLAYCAFRVGVIATAELSASPREALRLALAKRRYETRLRRLLKEERA